VPHFSLPHADPLPAPLAAFRAPALTELVGVVVFKRYSEGGTWGGPSIATDDRVFRLFVLMFKLCVLLGFVYPLLLCYALDEQATCIGVQEEVRCAVRTRVAASPTSASTPTSGAATQAQPCFARTETGACSWMDVPVAASNKRCVHGGRRFDASHVERIHTPSLQAGAGNTCHFSIPSRPPTMRGVGRLLVLLALLLAHQAQAQSEF